MTAAPPGMVTNTKVVGGLHFGSYQYLSIEVVRQDGSDRQKYGDGVAEKNFVLKCRRKFDKKLIDYQAVTDSAVV